MSPNSVPVRFASRYRCFRSGLLPTATATLAIMFAMDASLVSALPPAANMAANALQFNAAAKQGVDMDPAAGVFDGTTALTIETWVNITAWSATTKFDAIVTKGDAWGLVRSDNTSKICFRTLVTASPKVFDDLVSAEDFPVGSWHHVAAVYTGTKKQLFIDGVLSAEKAWSGPMLTKTDHVMIGNNYADATHAPQATVDSVRLWSVARTAAQIAARMGEYLRGSETGLVADWRFNEAIGTTVVADSSPGIHGGTLVFGAALPTRVNGLGLNPPSDGDLAISYNAAQVLVEASATTGVTETGTWTAAVYGGKAYHYDADAGIDLTKKVTFTPVITTAGGYDVYLRGINDPARTPLASTAIPVKLVIDGVTTAYTVDQKTVPGAWVKVNNAGAVTLKAGTTASLAIKAKAGSVALAGAALFVRNGQYVQVTSPTAGVLDTPNALTAEAWVKPAGLPVLGPVAILSKGVAAWEVRYLPTGKVSFITPGLTTTVLGGGGDLTELISTAAVKAGEWTHVAVVCDGLTKQIYLNGLLDASTALTPGTIGVSSVALVFGARPIAAPFSPPPATGVVACYAGAIDEVRLWNLARTAKEVQANYTLLVNGNEPGLIGAWSCDEAVDINPLAPAVPYHTANHTRLPLAAILASGMSSFNRVDGVRVGPDNTPLGAPSAANYTIALNGTNQFATVADNAVFSGLTNLTIEAWIKPTQTPGAAFADIVSKGTAGYGLGLDSGLHLRFLGTSVVDNSAPQSTGVVVLNAWNHVAVVVDGTAHTTTFYINGVAAGSVAGSVITSSAGTLAFGKHGGPLLGNFFQGGLDEVRIWSVARTATQIALLALSDLPAIENAGSLGRWAFTDGDGSTTVADSAPVPHTATLSGAPTWTTGPVFPLSPTLPTDLGNLTPNPSTVGLWVGDISLSSVNEVQAAVNGAANAVTPTGDSATIRIILHVDAGGKVRLLKDVIMMQTRPTGTPPPPATQVLVTDPSKIPNFQGIALRGGKLVGMRYGSAAFDFAGFASDMVGGIRVGGACAGRIDLDQDAPTNPYRHKFNPDHRHGFGITRVFSLKFDGTPGDPLAAAPGFGVDRITGVYRESITGLHKITLKTQGTVTLNRISTVATLNTP